MPGTISFVPHSIVLYLSAIHCESLSRSASSYLRSGPDTWYCVVGSCSVASSVSWMYTVGVCCVVAFPVLCVQVRAQLLLWSLGRDGKQKVFGGLTPSHRAIFCEELAALYESARSPDCVWVRLFKTDVDEDDCASLKDPEVTLGTRTFAARRGPSGSSTATRTSRRRPCGTCATPQLRRSRTSRQTTRSCS